MVGRPLRAGAHEHVDPARVIRHYRWDEIALEKVTEMISRKIVTGEREMLAQIWLKKGAIVPSHEHVSEQMTYILQGALKFTIDGEEFIVREGEVLHIPSSVPHQAEALDDTLRTRRVQPDPAGLAGQDGRLLSEEVGSQKQEAPLTIVRRQKTGTTTRAERQRMDTGLTGKVALVCAASRGLGKAAARGLAAEGARVAMCARHHADARGGGGRDPGRDRGRGAGDRGRPVAPRRHQRGWSIRPSGISAASTFSSPIRAGRRRACSARRPSRTGGTRSTSC